MVWRWWWLVFAALALAACGESGDGDGGGPGSADGGALDDGGSAAGDAGSPPAPTVILPRLGLSEDELAILVHEEDPQSVALGAYYAAARGIPPERVVSLSFEETGATLSEEVFRGLREQVDAALGPDVQALAITWTQPYRVDCMSITSAFTLGFDRAFCSDRSSGTCDPTAPSPYFGSQTTAPFTDLGIRPSMMLAAASVEEGEALIDRGVAADDTLPEGSGWLYWTTDEARSSRAPSFPRFAEFWDAEYSGVTFRFVDNRGGGSSGDALRGATDVLFYFTGLTEVPDLETNTFLPGAMADHLTSFGGQVPTSSQMSVVAWLEAGATGSYGTVVEPCNFPDKFSDVPSAVRRYVRGATLLEAYWASVRTPGEGLFVGEPMARPWRPQTSVWRPSGRLEIETNAPAAGDTWVLESAPSEEGPWTVELTDSVFRVGRRLIVLDGAFEAAYRYRRVR